EEYEAATQLGLPRYLFLADPATDADPALFPAAARDPDHRAQLDAFRAEVSVSHVVDFFTSPEDLAARVATALTGYLLKVKEEEMTGAMRVPRDLPPRASALVGRERELAQLRDALRPGTFGAGASAALAGMAGVGKSALAAEAVHTLAGEPGAFPGGVTWVRCDGRTGLPGLIWIEDQILGAWNITLAPEELARATTPDAEADLRERVLRARLRSTSTTGNPAPAAPRAALVLLDNIERDLPLDRALDVLAPLGISTLVTARHEPASPRLRLFALDVLDSGAAVALFGARYAARGGDWDAAREGAAAAEITEALGRLPLAIELAAARAARGRTGVAALAAELRDADRLGKLRDPVDRTRSVRYAFRQSLDTLSAVQRARFAALGLPDGATWPWPVVEHLLAAVPADPTEGAPADPAEDDLEMLAALSLVTVTTADAGQRVGLHPLLRELAREEWARQPETPRAACRDALLHAARDLAAHLGHDYPALAREEDLIASAVRLAARDQAAPHDVSATVAALESYLDTGGRWRLGLELAQAQLDACRALGDRRGEGQALNNQGYLALRLGRINDAASHYERALAVRREATDRAGEAETLNNLGALAQAQSQRSEARDYFEQALTIRRELTDRAGEATVLNNLGALANQEQRRDAAADAFARALALRRELGDRAGEGLVLNNLGGLAQEQGNLEDAKLNYEQALTLLHDAGNQANEAATLNNLGALAQVMDHPDEARRYFEQALTIRRAIGDRTGEGTTLANLGALAYAQSQFGAAARQFEAALTIQREVGDRAGEVATLGSLGAIARGQRRLNDARDHFESALAIQRARGDEAGTGIALNSLGQIAYAEGQRDKAINDFEQALAALERGGAADLAHVVRENLAGLRAQQSASAQPTAAAPFPAASTSAGQPATPAPAATAPAATAPATALVTPTPLEPPAPNSAPAPTMPETPAQPAPATPTPPARKWWPFGRH
ncbi:MAG TPA: tetratricopeptide repeat protein, partial [Ktedonobacterales bacterium]